MINRILRDKILSSVVRDTCCENEVCVDVDPRINRDDYIIIKPDDYYNSLNIAKRPAAVDCLIIQKCQDGRFKISLIELKSIGTTKHFELDNLIEKFQNTLSLFISKDFREFLLKDYKTVELYFVSNIEIYKRDIGLKLDTLINKKFHFNNRNYLIRPKKPTPLLRPCY